MCDYLSLTDLFLVGLGLDITGALLLAKGLLISPASISSIAVSRVGGNPETARDRCSSRVDAEFGVIYLAGGFALQVVGSALEIGGVETETGTGRLLIALGSTLIFAMSAFGAYALLHKRRVDRLVLETDKATEDLYQEQEQRRKRQENEERNQS